MNLSFLRLKPVVFACSLAIAGCGGGSSDPVDTGDSGNTGNVSTTLSGTAAAGAAIVGTVTVKGAMGNTNSALIEADGTYNVDVTGLTAPTDYVPRAQSAVKHTNYIPMRKLQMSMAL